MSYTFWKKSQQNNECPVHVLWPMRKTFILISLSPRRQPGRRMSRGVSVHKGRSKAWGGQGTCGGTANFNVPMPSQAGDCTQL